MEIIKDKRSGGLDLQVNLPTKYIFGGERIKKDKDGNPMIDKETGKFIPEKTNGLQELGSDLAAIPKMVYTKENGFGGNLEGAGKNVVAAGREAVNALVKTAKSGGGLDDLKESYNEGLSNAELALQSNRNENAKKALQDSKIEEMEKQLEILGQQSVAALGLDEDVEKAAQKNGTYKVDVEFYNSDTMTDAEKVAKVLGKDESKGNMAAYYDPESGKIFINIAKLTNEADLLATFADELSHQADAITGKDFTQERQDHSTERGTNFRGTFSAMWGKEAEQSDYRETMARYKDSVLANGEAGAARDVQPFLLYSEVKDHKQLTLKSMYYNQYLSQNTDLPETIDDVPPDWNQFDLNTFHTWDKENTVKYLAPDGREAVFNKETGLKTTNIKNRATFNLYDPTKLSGKVLHGSSDVYFYYRYGSGPDDPTTPLERIRKTFE